MAVNMIGIKIPELRRLSLFRGIEKLKITWPGIFLKRWPILSRKNRFSCLCYTLLSF